MSAIDRGALVHEVLERFVADVLARPPTVARARATAGRPATGRSSAAWPRRRAASTRPGGHRPTGVLATGQATDPRPGRPVPRRRRRPAAGHRHPPAGRRAGVRPGRRRPGRASRSTTAGRCGSGARPTASTRGGRRAGRPRLQTGRADAYRRLGPDNPDERGTRLQLAVYAQAARAVTGRPDAPVRAEYWFVSEGEASPATATSTTPCSTGCGPRWARSSTASSGVRSRPIPTTSSGPGWCAPGAIPTAWGWPSCAGPGAQARRPGGGRLRRAGRGDLP